MIVDMEANKKLSPIVIELFLRGRKLKTKCDTLFYDENTQQERTSTNSIKSLYCV